jgi:hypothetical protein
MRVDKMAQDVTYPKWGSVHLKSALAVGPLLIPFEHLHYLPVMEHHFYVQGPVREVVLAPIEYPGRRLESALPERSKLKLLVVREILHLLRGERLSRTISLRRRLGWMSIIGTREVSSRSKTAAVTLALAMLAT